MEAESITPINDALRMRQSQNGLLFGTDAYLLAAYLRRNASGRAYDLGSGSGAVSLLAAKNRAFSKITALELQAHSFSLLCENITDNGFEGRIEPLLCDVRRAKLRPGEEAADVVFCNPPYLAAQSGFARRHTESEIARREIEGGIADFCACAARLLRSGGYFYVCFLPARLTDLLFAMRQNCIEPKRLTLVYPTEAHRPSLVLAEGKKDAAPSLYVTKPLFMQQRGEDGQLRDTPQLAYIYREGAFLQEYEKP